MSDRQESADDVVPAFERTRVDLTGVPNLDQVLGGGVPRGSLVIVVGPPGSGKTTLANQMAFAAARAGRRAMVMTALSEPTGKLLAHLRSFTFFDDDLVGDTIQFVSLQQFLADGLDTTREALVNAARRAHAGFVVLDGFRGVRGADLDPQAARQFLYDVGTTLSVLGTTTLITSEADARDPQFFPEATTGDIIIGLHDDLFGVRQRRAIEPIKVRGAAPLSGLHGLTISAEGAIVYPRLESRVTAASNGSRVGELRAEDNADLALEARGELNGYAAFDLPELDALLDGGLTRGTSTLVTGALGTGKTLLALQFALAGVRAGEPTLFLSFRESRRQLFLKADPFTLGSELRAGLEPSGALRLLRWAPVELNPDVLADQVLATLDAIGARRFVVDSMIELERAVIGHGNDHRVNDYLAALAEALRMRGVTALFTREIRQVTTPELDFADNAVSLLAENVLLLRKLEEPDGLRRVISVIKMRFAPDETGSERAFTITTPTGITVLGAQASEGAARRGEDERA